MKKLSKIVLHIGAEKTGTTTIQKFMASNRSAMAMDRILYPITPGNDSHTRLAIFAANLNKKLGRFQKIENEKKLAEFRFNFELELTKEIQASDADTLILSTEWLHPRISEEDEFRRLSNLLYRFTDDVRVVLYVRRQDEMLVSLYSTSLRAGNTRKFSFPRITADALPYFLNYSAIANNWISAFGEEQLVVRVFSERRFVMGDLIRDFIQATGIAWNDEYCIPEKRSNQSINVVGQELARAFNKLSISMGLRPRVTRGVMNRLESQYAGRGIPTTRDAAYSFYRNFSSSNEALRERFFPISHTLFDEDFSAYPVQKPLLDEKHVQRLLSDLMADLHIK